MNFSFFLEIYSRKPFNHLSFLQLGSFTSILESIVATAFCSFYYRRLTVSHVMMYGWGLRWILACIGYSNQYQSSDIKDFFIYLYKRDDLRSTLRCCQKANAHHKHQCFSLRGLTGKWYQKASKWKLYVFAIVFSHNLQIKRVCRRLDDIHIPSLNTKELHEKRMEWMKIKMKKSKFHVSNPNRVLRTRLSFGR